MNTKATQDDHEFMKEAAEKKLEEMGWARNGKSPFND